jgi:hypothetical protein
MPHAVGVFLAYVGTAIYTGLLAVGVGEVAALFILDVGVKLAGLALLGALAKSLIQIPDINETARANVVTTRGTLQHQRLIYGEMLVSGPLWYMNTAGTHNQSLYHAVVLAGHEIEDITDVWFDDEIIPNASIDWAGNGSVDSGWLAGDTSLQTTAYLDKFLGADDQAASADLVSAFTEITSQHQGRGIAWFLARTDFFEGQTDVWSKGAPQNYKALVKGKLVYNPNSDGSTAWGTGPHRVDSSPTWEYSNNPALCWADYMIDSALGFGESPTRIDYAYVASVAAICSGSVATPNSETTQRFACNGTLSTGTTHQGNLESILSSANMTMALVQGVWKLRGWEYETPALAFTDDDLRGDLKISLSTEETGRYNTVRGSFIDPERKWQASQFPAFTSSEYVARDGSETLFSDIQLPMTTDIFMSQRLAAGILEQSDLQRVVVYPSNFKTLPVEIGGTIMLSNAKLGWDEDTFRVTNYKINDMKGIDLVMHEDNVAAYTDVATDEYATSSGGVYTRNDPGVPAPSSLWTSPLINAVLLSWTPPPARLFETVQVHWSTNNSRDQAIQVAAIDGHEFLHRTERPQLGYYWSRAENYAGGLSDFFPNSDQTDVVGIASLINTQKDRSFALSDVWPTFWNNGESSNASDYITISSSGINNQQALTFVKTNSIGGTFQHIGIEERIKESIQSELCELNIVYKVESWFGGGFDANSAGIYARLEGYGTPAIFDSGGGGGGGAGKPTPNPSSYDNVSVHETVIRATTLDTTNQWATAQFSLPSSGILHAGGTECAIEIGLRYHAADAEFKILVNHIGLNWK